MRTSKRAQEVDEARACRTEAHAHLAMGSSGSRPGKAVVMAGERCHACDRPYTEDMDRDEDADARQADPDSQGPVGNNLKPSGKLTAKQGAVAHREQRQKLQEANDVYPEIKIPPEFVAVFEQQNKLPPGDTVYAGRLVQDEIRIRYLQK